MAKRKKGRQTMKPGQNAIGGIPLVSGHPRYEGEGMLKSIQRAISGMNFQSKEELEQFLKEHFTGKPLDDMIDNHEPRTDLERAERILEDLPEDATAAEVVRAAETALKLSEDCLEAWLQLGLHERDPDGALAYFDKGIARGRVRFAPLIAANDGIHGLWGWVEARDFMRLLQQRALVLEATGGFAKAIEVYQEMLSLNPGDNQGVRGAMLRMFVVCDQIEDARKLLARFPADGLIDMRYGRALLAFVEAMDRTDFRYPDGEAGDLQRTPTNMMRSLGPAFDPARKLLNEAVGSNPFVPWLMTHPQLMDVEVGTGLVSSGGPLEGLKYAQDWAPVWCTLGLPFVAITASMRGDPLRVARKRRMLGEFLDIIADLEAADGSPWWGELGIQA